MIFHHSWALNWDKSIVIVIGYVSGYNNKLFRSVMGRVVNKFSFIFQILLHFKEYVINLNPCPAEPRFILFRNHCRSRSAKFNEAI